MVFKLAFGAYYVITGLKVRCMLRLTVPPYTSDITGAFWWAHKDSNLGPAD